VNCVGGDNIDVDDRLCRCTSSQAGTPRRVHSFLSTEFRVAPHVKKVALGKGRYKTLDLFIEVLHTRDCGFFLHPVLTAQP